VDEVAKIKKMGTGHASVVDVVFICSVEWDLFYALELS